jgi:4-amino-4-deoxy-L-arabinose transferase-like glycosyltransferase
VPTYAPGLPLLMALFTTVVGRCGPYLVNPVCGAMLIILTYALGSLVSGRGVGAVAALLVASSPTVLFMTLWPLSDVPAATFWTASLLLAARAAMPRPSWPAPREWKTAALIAGSGVAAGVAVAIRPNLFPLAVFPAAVAAWPIARATPLRATLRLATFGIACAPFVLFVAWFYNNLYGSPLQSGYGNTESMFAWDNFRANLARYPRWLWDSQGPLVFLFLLSPLLSDSPRPASRMLRRWFFTFVLAVFACYLWYLPFDTWWYLRFLLPAFPLIFVLAADVAWTGTRRNGLTRQVVALGVFAVVMVDYGATRAMEFHALGGGDEEQRYADVGRFVASRLPANAVAVTMQHSGSVRYYSGRPTLRYDRLDADWLDRAIAHLRASGLEPYLILERWEIAKFRERFATQRTLEFIDRPPLAVHSRDVYVYGTGASAGTDTSQPIPHTTGCE